MCVCPIGKSLSEGERERETEREKEEANYLVTADDGQSEGNHLVCMCQHEEQVVTRKEITLKRFVFFTMAATAVAKGKNDGEYENFVVPGTRRRNTPAICYTVRSFSFTPALSLSR